MFFDPLSGEQLLQRVLSAHTEWSQAPRSAGAIVNAAGEITSFVGTDATPETAFRIASMTKSFSAAAVLLLRDRGQLDLDAPIATYAPELGSVVSFGAEPVSITVRHLVTMSSGLASDDPWADRHLDASDDELDAWVRGGLRFSYPTGTAFEYSNLGFGLIGRVVLRITGETIQRFISRELLAPLGMLNTVWSLSQSPSGVDHAVGLHKAGGGFVDAPILDDGVIAPMGGLWSTAADLARWVSFLSSAFSSTPRTGPLSAGSRREMQRVHTFFLRGTSVDAFGHERTDAGGYAMGLNATVDKQQRPTIWHSGGLPGYGSTMRWWPGGGGIVLLANATYAPMTAAGAALMEALAAGKHDDRVVTEVSDDLASASSGLVALFNNWTDAAANSLFADNVGPDAALGERRSDAADVLAGSPVELVRIEPKSAAAGTLILQSGAPGARKEHRMFVMVSPIGGPQIQYYRWL